LSRIDKSFGLKHQTCFHFYPRRKDTPAKLHPQKFFMAVCSKWDCRAVGSAKIKTIQRIFKRNNQTIIQKSAPMNFQNLSAFCENRFWSFFLTLEKNFKNSHFCKIEIRQHFYILNITQCVIKVKSFLTQCVKKI
jgi:hypothetical protein